MIPKLAYEPDAQARANMFASMLVAHKKKGQFAAMLDGVGRNLLTCLARGVEPSEMIVIERNQLTALYHKLLFAILDEPVVTIWSGLCQDQRGKDETGLEDWIINPDLWVRAGLGHITPDKIKWIYFDPCGRATNFIRTTLPQMIQNGVKVVGINQSYHGGDIPVMWPAKSLIGGKPWCTFRQKEVVCKFWVKTCGFLDPPTQSGYRLLLLHITYAKSMHPDLTFQILDSELAASNVLDLDDFDGAEAGHGKGVRESDLHFLAHVEKKTRVAVPADQQLSGVGNQRLIKMRPSRDDRKQANPVDRWKCSRCLLYICDTDFGAPVSDDSIALSKHIKSGECERILNTNGNMWRSERPKESEPAETSTRPTRKRKVDEGGGRQQAAAAGANKRAKHVWKFPTPSMILFRTGITNSKRYPGKELCAVPFQRGKFTLAWLELPEYTPRTDQFSKALRGVQSMVDWERVRPTKDKDTGLSMVLGYLFKPMLDYYLGHVSFNERGEVVRGACNEYVNTVL